MAPEPKELFLIGADLLALLALASIAYRLISEYLEGTLTRKTLLVGGFLFAGTLGLLAAGIQTLVLGPGL